MAAHTVHVNPPTGGGDSSRQSNAEQKAERDRRVAAIDQGVDNVSYQGSFSIERRSGIPVQRINSNVNDEIVSGWCRSLSSSASAAGNLNGTISRWRVQASRLSSPPTDGGPIGWDSATIRSRHRSKDRCRRRCRPNRRTEIC